MTYNRLHRCVGDSAGWSIARTWSQGFIVSRLDLVLAAGGELPGNSEVLRKMGRNAGVEIGMTIGGVESIGVVTVSGGC